MMIAIMGYVALFFTAQNIIAAFASRMGGIPKDSFNIEAAIWFVAACLCFKG